MREYSAQPGVQFVGGDMIAVCELIKEPENAMHFDSLGQS